MSGIEITLIITGVTAVVVSFVFSGLFANKETKGIDNDTVMKVSEEIVRAEVDRELANVIDEKLEETEAQLDKITNEKIMSLGSYSETILEEVGKNHNEAMFLYNMLLNKEESIKNTMKDIEVLKSGVRKMMLTNDIAKEEAKKSESGKTDERTEYHDTASGSLKNFKKESGKTTGITVETARKGKNNNRRILDLHEKGKTNVEIARELGLGMGEVRLVIDLFNSKETPI